MAVLALTGWRPSNPFATLFAAVCSVPLTIAPSILILVLFSAFGPSSVKFIINALLVAAFVDLGFADLLLLETLRHKTSLTGYIAIHFQGFLANKGGMQFGWCGPSVYVWKDSFTGIQFKKVDKDKMIRRIRAGEPTTTNDDNLTVADIDDHIGKAYWSTVTSHMFKVQQGNWFAFLGGSKAFAYRICGRSIKERFEGDRLNIDGLGFAGKAVVYLWGALVALQPFVKVRCTLNDLANPEHPFREDPEIPQLAMLTPNDIPPHWIGMAGTIYHHVCRVCAPTPQSVGYCGEMCRGPGRTVVKLMSGCFWMSFAVAWPFLVDMNESAIAIVVFQYI